MGVRTHCVHRSDWVADYAFEFARPVVLCTQCSVGVCILFHVSCKATLHLDPANNLSDASLSQRALKFRPGGTFLGTSLRGEHNLPPLQLVKGFLSVRSKWEQIPTVPICPTGPDDHVCRFKWRCSRYSTEIKDTYMNFANHRIT